MEEKRDHLEQDCPMGAPAGNMDLDAVSPGETNTFEGNPLREELPEEDGVFAFSPSDFAYAPRPDRKRKKSRVKKKALTLKKKIALTLLLSFAIVGLLIGGIYLHRLKTNPSAFFMSAGATPTPVPEAMAEAVVNTTPSPTPEPTATPSALDLLTAQADTDMMNNIINIALIGVDYAEERETWNGKHEYHADVIMIMAVNFDEKRVDLISIPRDTYANIPGIRGVYKINASINCGGGFEAEGGAGFLKTCETASWMLGGIPVEYYYAVTMPAVKELVDAFGGVDYDLELSFTMAGRKYYKGQQHMNGQGVLDYLRVRKNISSSGDLNRINRQKDMLVALFQQMQSNNLIVRIPDMINAFDGQLFTNCTLSQTAALARFAYDLDADNIGMYSMDGRMRNIFGWNFVLTDQEKRVDIIKEVYGVDVPEELAYSATYAQYLWQSMLAERYLKTTSSFKNKVTQAVKQGSLEPEYSGGGSYDEPDMDSGSSSDSGYTGDGDFILMGTPGKLPLKKNTLASPILPGDGVLGYTQSAYDAYLGFISAYEEVQADLEYANEQAEKYLNGEDNKLSGAASSLSSANNRLKNYATSAASQFDISGGFNWNQHFYVTDPDYNEIYVDFR